MAEHDKVPMWKWYKECSLQGIDVVVACVSVGNVPQLTCDLLIASLDMEHAAALYSPAFVPMCGPDPYSLKSKRLCGPADLYVSTDKKFAILQVRSALIRGKTQKFLNELVQSLKENRVRDMIILTSSFAHEKHRVMSSSFRYYTNDLFDRSLDSSWIKHERTNSELVIHGGGFACNLLEICSDAAVPAMILYKYCSEGNNIPDAVDFVGILSQILPLFLDDGASLETKLKQPISWRLLFGGPPPVEMY